MRCKNCDYPLWQIRDRRCPECGTGFRPSDFDFVLNSVRFCCPHCDQAYYGTGERGHLSPRTFACVSCNQMVNMDDMVLLPTEGVREEQTKVEMNPWLERDKRGFFRAWLSTTMKALGTPNRLMEATPDNASTLQSAWSRADHQRRIRLHGTAAALRRVDAVHHVRSGRRRFRRHGGRPDRVLPLPCGGRADRARSSGPRRRTSSWC